LFDRQIIVDFDYLGQVSSSPVPKKVNFSGVQNGRTVSASPSSNFAAFFDLLDRNFRPVRGHSWSFLGPPRFAFVRGTTV
jgi:hypothetical protein